MLFRDFFTLKILILGPVLLYSAIATTVGTQPLSLLYWPVENLNNIFYQNESDVSARRRL